MYRISLPIIIIIIISSSSITSSISMISMISICVVTMLYYYYSLYYYILINDCISNCVYISIIEYLTIYTMCFYYYLTTTGIMLLSTVRSYLAPVGGAEASVRPLTVRGEITPGLHCKIPVFSDPAPGKS